MEQVIGTPLLLVLADLLVLFRIGKWPCKIEVPARQMVEWTGVEKDEARAVEWIRRAASRDAPDARAFRKPAEKKTPPKAAGPISDSNSFSDAQNVSEFK